MSTCMSTEYGSIARKIRRPTAGMPGGPFIQGAERAAHREPPARKKDMSAGRASSSWAQALPTLIPIESEAHGRPERSYETSTFARHATGGYAGPLRDVTTLRPKSVPGRRQALGGLVTTIRANDHERPQGPMHEKNPYRRDHAPQHRPGSLPPLHRRAAAVYTAPRRTHATNTATGST